MADYRAIAWNIVERQDVEIADSDTLNVGNIAPLSGALTLGGSAGTQDVYIANGHDLQVGGAGAEFRVDGGANTLIQGSGSFQVSATGTHRIYGGTLSLEVPTSLSDTLTLINGQTVTTSNNGDITLDPHGTGTVNISSNFYATGFDLGDSANRAGTLYADTINANNIVGVLATCGTNCNVWQVNEDAVLGTQEYAGSVWLDGDGTANIEGWRVRDDGGTQEFKLQYKQNPVDPSDLTETWTDILTGTPTSLTSNVTFNATTVNATTVNATTISGTFAGTIATCGTSCNVWEVNNDAVGTTVEDVGVALPAADGTNIENWQVVSVGSTQDLHFKYKQNPTDPADLSEPGYLTTLVLAQNGAAQLTGSLGVSGTTIQFSSGAGLLTAASGDLTLAAAAGANDILANASLVDLRTNVGTLDVPAGTGFSIAGTALTTALWTATGVDTILGGPASNADAYHTHAGAGVGSGTNSDVWVVNQDISSSGAEPSGSVWPSADGSDVFAWRNRVDTVGILHTEYKTNPTDLTDLTEAGWTSWVEYDDNAAELRCELDLIFPDGGSIGTTNNGSLNLDVNGTGDLVVVADNWNLASNGNVSTDGTQYYFTTNGIVNAQAGRLVLRASNFVMGDAPLVDLNTSVGVLDVPSGVNFKIAGTALTTALWTAAGVDTILGGPTANADAYHTHSTIIGDGTNSNIWAVNEDAVPTTAENVGVMWESADGVAAINNWRQLTTTGGREFHFQYKQNPTDPKDLTEVGYTDFIWFDGPAGDTHISSLVADGDIYIDGHDIGTVGNPAGDIYATNIYGSFSGAITSCGTSCNVWEVNDDAAGTTAEDTGIALPAGDGVNLQNFQLYNNSSAPEVILRYKQNPSDPADFTEAGYTPMITFATTNIVANVKFDATAGLDVSGAALTVDVNGIDSAGNIDLNDTLSFDAAGFIDTSGNNNLTINTGTQNLLVTAGLVDLQTNVTTLDVPDQTGFSIGGTALTTANWTAPNVDTLLDGSNADALHTHSGIGGVHIYPPSTTNPTGPPTPTDGDQYFNTTTESWQYYDASRSKWLSVTEFVMNFGDDSADGTMLAGYGITAAGTGTGVLIPRDATVKRITAYARAGNLTKTFNLLVNGASTSSFSLAAGIYKNNAADIDFSEDDYVWVEATAAGTATRDVTVVLWLAWRT